MRALPNLVVLVTFCLSWLLVLTRGLELVVTLGPVLHGLAVLALFAGSLAWAYRTRPARELETWAECQSKEYRVDALRAGVSNFGDNLPPVGGRGLVIVYMLLAIPRWIVAVAETLRESDAAR